MSAQSPDFSSADDDLQEHTFASRRCCFFMRCVESNLWEPMRSPDDHDRWWSRSWKKVREWSELVAGPRWKTFIRRINRGRTAGKQGNNFQYDFLSYTLNFDEGTRHDANDYLRMDFSSRWASIPVTAKTSMDLGMDVPTFGHVIDNK